MTAREDLIAAPSFHPTIGKALVALIAAGWLLLSGPWPESLNGTGALVIIALFALDVLLAITTGWVAFTPGSRLDEREAALRDRAYRIAFRLVAVGIVLMFALTVVGGIIAGNSSMIRVSAIVPDGFNGRTIAAVIELLGMLPTAVIAWLQTSEMDFGLLTPVRWLPFLGVPLLALGWGALIAVGPAQSITQVGSNNTGFSELNASCEHYAAQQRVGLGFGGAARLGAEVCWNGLKAWVVGDPNLTPPGAGLPDEAKFVPRFSDLFSCTPYPGDSDLAAVSEQCTEQIDNLGTMRLIMRSKISPLPGGIGARQLRMELVVDHWGRLVSFQ